jgi:magnesium transporter
MNFRHMPELDWRLGYPVALLLMALVAGSLMAFFRRHGWI